MKHLTSEQRYVISALKKRGETLEIIGKELGVHKSTISRELKRNCTKTGKYTPHHAQEYANERKERFKHNRSFTHEVENRCIYYLIHEQWSPDEIVGYCNKNNLSIVSTERIYQYLRYNKQQGGDLYKHLRHRLKHRKRILNGTCKVKIKDRVSIDKRPDRINNREEFGHWEADLIEGKNHSGIILTLTERISKILFMKYLPTGKNALGVAKGIIDLLLPYKKSVLSITMDNGLEFAEHKKVSKKFNADIYFAHPYCSWEKGQIENMNKLIRQYYRKKEPITKLNTLNIKDIQYKLNRRPRKTLEYERPFKIFYNFVNKKVAFGS